MNFIKKIKQNKKNTGFTRIVDFKETTPSRTKSASLKLTTGFTIIEMMVAIAVFLIVIMAGMGAILNSYKIHNKTQKMRSIMDNLTFIMEDMSRNIRVGTHYYCITNDSAPPTNQDYTFQDCTNGKAMAFLKTDGYDQSTLGYQISYPKIIKFIDGAETDLTPTEVSIDSTSGFTVIGSEQQASDGTGDSQQPLVIIKLSGKIHYQNTDTPFSLETIVSQRAIDIEESAPTVN